MDLRYITHPRIIFSRSSVLSRPCPVPAEPGVYAWFFKDVPPGVPTEGCISENDLHLLYVGISPDKLGKPDSRQNLRTRISNHYRGNAEGSTLRRSLGILLQPFSGFPLRRVGSGRRMTFTHIGEQWLDNWMEENAFVAWFEDDAPWVIEDALLASIGLPLNIKGNKHHPFSSDLSQMRRQALQKARDEAIANEDNQSRRC